MINKNHQNYDNFDTIHISIMLAVITLLLAATACTAFVHGRPGAGIINARTGVAEPLKMGVTLEDLPYDYKALEPYLGEQTLRIHHGMLLYQDYQAI